MPLPVEVGGGDEALDVATAVITFVAWTAERTEEARSADDDNDADALPVTLAAAPTMEESGGKLEPR